ncbi:hypothetical protein BGX38DRAFT_1273242 [Terfezia claveryi]|nr:hypothetical protein BGX38DRAFT_1273242 [Terfezia claveryi]
MASRNDSNPPQAQRSAFKETKLSTKPGAPLKRLASTIYLYLKPKTFRSPSEHILFTEVVSILDLMSDNEKASMLITRTSRNRSRPLTPTPKEIKDFTSMRSAFLNGIKRKAPLEELQPRKDRSRTCSPAADTPTFEKTPPRHTPNEDTQIPPTTLRMEPRTPEVEDYPQVNDELLGAHAAYSLRQQQ